MAQQTINVGTAPNDGTGTPLRTAFQYTNSNFSELYTAVGPSGNNIVVPGNATITGDLTVDTSTLKVDSTNNRVGIGTATLFGDLNIQNGTNCRFELGSAAGGTVIENLNNARNAYLDMTMYADAYIWNRLGSEVMRLNSTGLGVGTSNFAYKINAAGFIAAVDPSFTGTGGSLIGAMLNNDNTAPGLDLRRWTGTAGTHGTTYIATDATGATFFYNGQQASNTKATSLKMTLDASGNLGIGVTPVTGGKLTVAGPIVRNKGNATLTQNVATTVATLPGEGLFIAYAYTNASNPSAFTSYAVILCDSVGSRVIANNGTQISITTSTFALQVTQIFAATLNVVWSFVQIG